MGEVLSDLEEGLQDYDGTEQSFKSAAKDAGVSVSEDSAVLKGRYISDAMDDWVFSAERKAGEYQFFAVEEAVYYVRYVSSGEACWKVQARQQLVQQKQNNTDVSLLEQYPGEEKTLLYAQISG